MLDLKVCAECGVPEYITGEHLWLNNGDIVLNRAQRSRMIFFESDNFDPLFHNIEQIMGLSIEHIIMDAVARATRAYMSLMIPKEVLSLIRNKELDSMPVALATIDIARMLGYGNVKTLRSRYEQDDDDYYIAEIIEPFSMPILSAALAGTIEVIRSADYGFSYERLSQNSYKVTASPSPRPEVLEQKMHARAYHHKDGDIDLERCPSCGGPRVLSDYQWHLDRGVITNRAKGRRMIMMGAQELEPVFEALESELGETVNEVVVEAQRRITAGGFYSIRDYASVEDFRSQLALEGLGNLRRLEIGRRGLSMRLDNASLHLIGTGIMQGIFDAAFDTNSRVEWELSEKGDLEIEVTPVS